MDFIEGLPKSLGYEVIFVVVDRLSKYSHFIALGHPYTAATVAQAFLDNVYKLHGTPETIISDRDKIFVSNFWSELFRLLGTTLKLSTAYHPQTDGKTEVVNRCLETYLRCMCGDKPKDWSKWLPLAEWWYNTTFHSAAQATPFEIIYGQSPPLHLPYIPGDTAVAMVDRSLQARETSIKMLKFHLQRAQNRMKQQADKHRTDRSFMVGNFVYVKLQPYRLSTVANRLNMKLSARYYGPYKVLQKFGLVAYKLELPAGSRIHPVFHVSQLKKCVGSIEVQSALPLTDADGLIEKVPLAILDRRMVKKGNAAMTEVLVQWSNSFEEDATWESLSKFQKKFPDFHS